MNTYLIVLLAYILFILSVSAWRSRKTRTQEEFMVAGRSVPAWLLVGSLVCTWIGAGSLLGGGGRACRGGLSQLWMSAGAWVAILIVYFLAGRVQRLGQYTVPDILERRYHPLARILGTLVVVVGSCIIFGYQCRGGGIVLHLLLGWDLNIGIYLTAAIIVLFTMLAGLRSIVTIDIFNGALITISVFIGLPVLLLGLGDGSLAGGVDYVRTTLPETHLSLFGNLKPRAGLFWAIGVFLPTFLLLLGESSMYQKFFSARSASAARRSVIGFIVGVVLVEVTLALFAVTATSHPKIQAWFSSVENFKTAETRALDPSARDKNWETLRQGLDINVGDMASRPDDPEKALEVAGTELRKRTDEINLYAAFHILPLWAGCLLLVGGMAIILSTGNSFMMAPSTAFTRDIWQRFLRPDASQQEVIWVQRASMGVLAVMAILALTQFETVWEMALVAYTMIGVGLTPAILAAFLWKRATPAGGTSAIGAGMLVCFVFAVLNKIGVDQVWVFRTEGDFIIYPSLIAGLACLVLVSLLGRPPAEEKWKPFQSEG